MEKVLQHLKEHWRSYLPLVFAVFGFIIYFFFVYPSKEEPTFTYEQPSVHEEAIANEEQVEDQSFLLEEVVVDVKGAVKRPGVYTMAEGDRLVDAIEKAGGLLEVADDASLNYALRLEDEMVVYVPKEGEEVEEIEGSFSPTASEQSKTININRATEEELMTISGIGPAKAAAIIDHREKEGKFEKKEDIMQVSGIGEKTFENIADQIDVK